MRFSGSVLTLPIATVAVVLAAAAAATVWFGHASLPAWPDQEVAWLGDAEGISAADPGQMGSCLLMQMAAVRSAHQSDFSPASEFATLVVAEDPLGLPSQTPSPVLQRTPNHKVTGNGTGPAYQAEVAGKKPVENSINQTISDINEVLGGNETAAGVMRIKVDGEGDSFALTTSIIFTFMLCTFSFIAFGTFRRRYPEIYSYRVHEGSSPPGPSIFGFIEWSRKLSWRLTADEVVQTAGLDAWMHLELQLVALRIIAWLSLITLVLLPIHWFCNGSDSVYDVLSRLSLSGIKKDVNLAVVWVHAGIVWFVVLITTFSLFSSQRSFLPLRFGWLRTMPEPQATTLLVEGIPEPYRSDELLRRYFCDMFSEKVVVSAYVVRNTSLLLHLQSCLEQTDQDLKDAEAEWSNAGRPPDQRPTLPLLAGLTAGHDAIEEHTKRKKELADEVAAERACVARVATLADPRVNSSTGFVTFRTRRDAQMASRQQLDFDDDKFILRPAPPPADVIYENLLDNPAAQTFGEASAWVRSRAGIATPAGAGRFVHNLVFHGEIYGWACIVVLFALWIPLVVFISGLTSLNSLQASIPVLQDWCKRFPLLNALLEGVLATLGLNVLMGVLPWILLTVVQHFFKLKAGAWAQLWLERLYFVFLFVFVLLVTAVGRGLIQTFTATLNNPPSVITLLARTLPTASHFYLSYVILGWFSCCLELLRIAPLVKFVFYKMVMSNEEARSLSEKEAVYPGPRFSMSVLVLIITIVFSNLCPPILALAWVYFALRRVVLSYLVCFAEPKQADLGGAIWVAALKQVFAGLFVYILMMLGVISAHSKGHPGPFVFALPTLPLVAIAWNRFDSQYRWEGLPLEEVARIDENAAKHAKQSVGAYVQPECLPAHT